MSVVWADTVIWSDTRGEDFQVWHFWPCGFNGFLGDILIKGLPQLARHCQPPKWTSSGDGAHCDTSHQMYVYINVCLDLDLFLRSLEHATSPVVAFYFQLTWRTTNLPWHPRADVASVAGHQATFLTDSQPRAHIHTHTKRRGLNAHELRARRQSLPPLSAGWRLKSLGMHAHLGCQRVERSARRPFSAAVTLPPLPTRRLAAEELCVRNVSPRPLAKQSATTASKVCQKAT